MMAACIACMLPLQAQITWHAVEPGVWKGTMGTPEAYSLLEVAGCTPQKEGFGRLPEVDLPDWVDQIVGNVQNGKTSLRIPLQKKEQLYGFGLNFQTVHQRGKILNLHVDHYGGKDNGRTHAPVPFYISSRGYGVFINSARYLTVYAGAGARKDSPEAPVAKDRNTDKTWVSRPYSDAVSVLVPAEGVEIYLFAGQATRKVVLPKGDWYDFYTGKYAGNGETIVVTPGLDRIPVYVKDGGIIPMMEPRLHAPAAGEKINLEIRHYGKAEGNYRLYDDDGETFDYEKGAFCWRDIKVTRRRNGMLKGTISKGENGKPNSIASVTWKFMSM